MSTNNNFPKLHNAMWPGLVGKGSPGAEPCIELDTMLDRAATQQEQEISNYTSVLTSLLEPVLILVMGAVVLIIVLAILMPIIEMNQMVH